MICFSTSSRGLKAPWLRPIKPIFAEDCPANILVCRDGPEDVSERQEYPYIPRMLLVRIKRTLVPGLSLIRCVHWQMVVSLVNPSFRSASASSLIVEVQEVKRFCLSPSAIKCDSRGARQQRPILDLPFQPSSCPAKKINLPSRRMT